MKWTATILLKSNKHVIVENLISIDTQNVHDLAVKKLTDFKAFSLNKGETLTFVGENNVVSLNSSDIEYVDISSNA